MFLVSYQETPVIRMVSTLILPRRFIHKRASPIAGIASGGVVGLDKNF
jgi:hypothetical protein